MRKVNEGIGIHAKTLGGDVADRGQSSRSANTATGQAVALVQHQHHQPLEQQQSQSVGRQTQGAGGSQDQGATGSSSSSPSGVGASGHCQFADEDVVVFECQASILLLFDHECPGG